MAILAYLVARMKEPSTYAGLAALLGVFGIKLAPEAMTSVIATLTALAGLIAVFFPGNARSMAAVSS